MVGNPLKLNLTDTEFQTEYRRLLSIARHYVRHPIQPEDIVQQILTEELEHGREIKTGSVSYTAVKHRCYDTLRRYHREQRYCESVCKACQANTRINNSDRDTSNAGELRREDISSDVEVLLGRTCLSPLEQHVLYLKFYKGRTVHQCSAELQRTHKEVRLALHSAIEKIKATQRGLIE